MKKPERCNCKWLQRTTKLFHCTNELELIQLIFVLCGVLIDVSNWCDEISQKRDVRYCSPPTSIAQNHLRQRMRRSFCLMICLCHQSKWVGKTHKFSLALNFHFNCIMSVCAKIVVLLQKLCVWRYTEREKGSGSDDCQHFVCCGFKNYRQIYSLRPQINLATASTRRRHTLWNCCSLKLDSDQTAIGKLINRAQHPGAFCVLSVFGEFSNLAMIKMFVSR